MGNSILVDTEVTNLSEILTISRGMYAKEAKQYTQENPGGEIHARLWRHFKDPSDHNNTEPVNLMSFEFGFQENECYTLLLMSTDKIGEFPTNLVEILDCVNVLKTNNYQILSCNGKRSSQILRAYALYSSFELEDIMKAPGVYDFLIFGGAVKSRKLRKVRKMDWSLPLEITPVKVDVFGLFTKHFLNTPPEQKSPIRPKPALKLSGIGLKTREDEFNELANNKENLANLDLNLDVRNTNRQVLKLGQFSDVCSEVYPNIYVGGVSVAKNYQQLVDNGITHVINCAGDVCRNYHPDHFVYKTYFLKDSKIENIECIFYPSIMFIEEAIRGGGRVFVHCMQGVSRSVTVCLSYIMVKERQSFNEAHPVIKEKRGIASPNIGFTCQLIDWHKRFTKTWNGPQFFAICSHQVEQPHTVVARLIEKPNLDSRGVFIVINSGKAWIWRGRQVWENNQERYMSVAHEHLRQMQQYESCPSDIQEINEGSEPEEFKSIEGLTIDNVWNYDNWYPHLDRVVDMEPQSYRELQEEDDPRRQESKRAKLYVYPSIDGEVIFEIDEMNEFAMLAMCYENKCMIWVGERFEVEELEEEEFISQVQKDYWTDPNEAQITYETQGEESDEFLDLF